MARGQAAASSTCKREVRFPATGRDTKDGPTGSAELSRRARLQLAAVAGAGGGSRRRRSSGRFAGHRSSCSGFEPNYDPDGGLSDSNSLEDSSASTDDENVSRQKKLLEDALFGFFKKENKRLKAPGVGRDAFSVYSGKYFSEIINRMPIGRKDVISKYERTEVPSSFVRWIAACVDTVFSQIIIVDDKIIELSKHSVHLVLGLPNSRVGIIFRSIRDDKPRQVYIYILIISVSVISIPHLLILIISFIQFISFFVHFSCYHYSFSVFRYLFSLYICPQSSSVFSF